MRGPIEYRLFKLYTNIKKVNDLHVLCRFDEMEI
jgi:hypothetical protein